MRILKKVSSEVDSTVKFLIQLDDGLLIESVRVPSRHGQSLCLSSQVGCACGCLFCDTAGMGFQRNLAPEEIIGQFELVSKVTGPVTNIVFMGMGEPLLNLENVSRAVSWFTDDSNLKVPRTRITLSTVGIIPGICSMAEQGPYINLAVTLFSAFQNVRSKFIPVALEHDLENLKRACTYYQRKREKQLLFSIPLIAGVNDAPGDAKAVVEFLDGLDAKVNLIPLNPRTGDGQKAPESEVVDRFHKIILDSGIPVFTRASKGTDISAACGQLAAKSMPVL